MGSADRAAAGFALAATVMDDRGAARARPGLDDGLCTSLLPRAVELSTMEPDARRTTVRKLASVVRPPIDPAVPLPPRARALLAAEAPRSVGRLWLAEGQPPRRGFVAGAGLRAALRDIRRSPVADATVARRERGRGRELLARGRRDLEPGRFEGLLATLDPGEAASVMALADLGPAPPPLTALDRALVRAAVRVAAPGELTRVLGAMQLGVDGELDGDRDSAPHRRAGREIADLHALGLLEEAPCRG